MASSEEFWNKVAACFAQRPIADLEAYHAKLDATKACLEPDDVILDVGCGAGTLALELATCVSEVHAIDPSSEMIKIANQRAADENTIFDLLKPGGFFISTTPCLGDSHVPFRLLLPIMRWLGRAPAVQVFGIQELENDLLDAGFVQINERKVSSDKTNAFLIAARPATSRSAPRRPPEALP